METEKEIVLRLRPELEKYFLTDNREETVKIEFFLKNKSLGEYPLIERSSQEERNEVAIKNGIKFYDLFVLDGGRVNAIVENGKVAKYKVNKEKRWHTEFLE